jgi:hypothetical protein
MRQRCCCLFSWPFFSKRLCFLVLQSFSEIVLIFALLMEKLFKSLVFAKLSFENVGHLKLTERVILPSIHMEVLTICNVNLL